MCYRNKARKLLLQFKREKEKEKKKLAGKNHTKEESNNNWIRRESCMQYKANNLEGVKGKEEKRKRG